MCRPVNGVGLSSWSGCACLWFNTSTYGRFWILVTGLSSSILMSEVTPLHLDCSLVRKTEKSVFVARIPWDNRGFLFNDLYCSVSTRGWVTIFEYSNILFNYRLSIRLCDYFLKGVPGLDNKDCPMAWRPLGFVTCQIGPLHMVTNWYHLHEI